MSSGLDGTSTTKLSGGSNGKALAFTNGSTVYPLHSVEVALSVGDVAVANDHSYFGLYSDAGGKPGSELVALELPTFTATGFYDEVLLLPAAAFQLQANTTYWVVGYNTAGSTTDLQWFYNTGSVVTDGDASIPSPLGYYYTPGDTQTDPNSWSGTSSAYNDMVVNAIANTDLNDTYSGTIYEDDFDRGDHPDLNYTPARAYLWQESENGVYGEDSVSVDAGTLRILSVDPGGDGIRFYVDRDLDGMQTYDIEFTLDLGAMSSWSYGGSGLWLMPRAEGTDLPGNRGWYVRMVDVTPEESISVYRYEGSAPDANGSLAGVELTTSGATRLDRDKPAEVHIAVDGDEAILTIDQSSQGGPVFVSVPLALGSGSNLYDNGIADVFLMGAQQVQTGNRGIDARIDDLELSAYAESAIADKGRWDDLLRSYGILLKQPAPSGLDQSAGRTLFRQAYDAYLHSDSMSVLAEMDALEDWFSAVAAWYEAKDDYIHRMLHGQNYAAAEPHLDAALAIINSGQSAGVRAELANLEAIKDAAGEPVTSYWRSPNRWGWVKAMNLMGYRRPVDEGEQREPHPWFTYMMDTTGVNFSSVLAFVPDGESHSYVESRTIQQQPYADARFHPVPGNHAYTFERDWTTSHWDAPEGKRITYSVLTPLMLQDGTDTFFVKFPYRYGTTQVESIVALWIESAGQFAAVTPANPSVPSMDSATAILETNVGYYLIVIPEYIESIAITDYQLEIETLLPTNFAMMKMQTGFTPSGNPGDHPSLIDAADFWTSVAIDCPIAVSESMQGNQVTMDYSYRTTSTVFGTVPHRIAPIPPLALLADLTIAGAQTAPHSIETDKDYGDYGYVDGSQLVYTIPSISRSALHGANIPVDTGMDQTDYAELAEWGVRVARLYQSNTTDPTQLKADFQTALQLCEDYGIKAIIDPHEAVFRMSYNDVFDSQTLQDYIDWWVELAQNATPWQDTVMGYDFYNEPPLQRPSRMGQWVAQAEQVSAAIQAVDPDSLHYVSAIDYGSAGGLYYLDAEMPDPLMRPTFHFYTPYSFTHQKIPQQDSDAAFVWYPGWAPGVDHGSTHYGYNREPTFYDKWIVGGAMLPAFEYAAKYNTELLLGEFSPLGYTRSGAEYASAVWNRHVVEWAVRYGMDTTLWAYHGSGLEHDQVKEQMLEFWNLQRGLAMDAADITPYGTNQNGWGGLPTDFTLSEGGRKLTLTGNAWYKYELPENYTLTADTMLDVTFSSTNEGELHGVGLDEDNIENQSNQKRAVLLYGTQSWSDGIAIGAGDHYGNFAPDAITYTIPIGSMYGNAGSMNYLIFVNDDDADGDAISVFKDIRIYED